jgi:hypothetical protein
LATLIYFVKGLSQTLVAQQSVTKLALVIQTNSVTSRALAELELLLTNNPVLLVAKT